MLPYLHMPVGREFKRIFHGRGKCYPGLAHLSIDWIAPVVHITLYQAVERCWLDELVAELKQRFLSAGAPKLEGVVVQYRDQFAGPREWMFGEPVEQLLTEEDGLRYQMRLGKAQNYGLFPDMASGRAWVANHAKDKRVLNLFAYTCGFSVAAIAGGAEHVVNVDMAKGPLATGRDNHRLNQHDLRSVRFEALNIFKSWGRIKRHGPYDLLISDPPSFQKGSIDIVKDYARIIKRIPELLKPGGKALLCLNSPALDSNFLLTEVSNHCPALHFEQRLLPGEDFPESEPEQGLKVLIFSYLPEAADE